jgi:AraC-like DNA-binding protein
VDLRKSAGYRNLGNVSPSSNGMPFMPLTNQVLFMIERDLNRDLNLGELAKSCGVSRFHLAHAFGEMKGFSVMEYVRRRRLRGVQPGLQG